MNRLSGLDLFAHANRGYVDEKADDRFADWTNHDLRYFLLNQTCLLGIDFFAHANRDYVDKKAGDRLGDWTNHDLRYFLINQTCLLMLPVHPPRPAIAPESAHLIRGSPCSLPSTS